jgi:hypothetical protein
VFSALNGEERALCLAAAFGANDLGGRQIVFDIDVAATTVKYRWQMLILDNPNGAGIRPVSKKLSGDDYAAISRKRCVPAIILPQGIGTSRQSEALFDLSYRSHVRQWRTCETVLLRAACKGSDGQCLSRETFSA